MRPRDERLVVSSDAAGWRQDKVAMAYRLRFLRNGLREGEKLTNVFGKVTSTRKLSHNEHHEAKQIDLYSGFSVRLICCLGGVHGGIGDLVITLYTDTEKKSMMLFDLQSEEARCVHVAESEENLLASVDYDQQLRDLNER